MQSWMIGLVSGIVFGGYWTRLPPWQLSLALVAVALILRPWHSSHSALRLLIAGLACGSALALVSGTLLLDHRITKECVGLPVVVTGTVSSLPRSGEMPGGVIRQRFEFTVDELYPERCAGPQNLMLSYYGDHLIEPGIKWQFEAKLKKPWGLANPGVYNMQAWFAQRGVDAVGSVRNAAKAQQLSASPALTGIPNRLRQRISEHIQDLGLQPDVTSVLRAITVADSSAIDSRLWFLFQQFGLNHLLVISGLHIGMVAGVGYLLGGLFLKIFSPVLSNGSWLPSVLALLLAGLYAALAGFSLPAQRALCMLACFVVASLAGRHSGSARSYLIAASAVLILEPLAAIGSGFWLSFGAVGALLWLACWQRGFGSFTRLLTTQLYMSVLMLPLGAFFFGGGSLAALLANVLMIPLLSIVVVPAALAAVVCFLLGWNIESHVWQLAAWPLGKLLPVAADVAERAGGWLYVPLTANVNEILPSVLAVALFALPGRSVMKPLAVILTLPFLLPINPVMTTAPGSTRVTVLDVGQGTAVVVHSGDRVLLYDTGGGDPNGLNMGSMAALPFLRGQGITRLDTVVISHADLDHSAGLDAVRNALPIDRLRYGGLPAHYSQRMTTGRPCVAGESWHWPGGQTFQFLSPALETPRKRNNNSCVLQLQIGEYRILLAGDIEEHRERLLVRYWGEYLTSEWLLAAHHGSKTSTTPTFLKRVQPQIVVISAGYANRFGHPHFTVSERLQHSDATTLSTATSGALEFYFEPGQRLRIRAYRQTDHRYWM